MVARGETSLTFGACNPAYMRVLTNVVCHPSELIAGFYGTRRRERPVDRCAERNGQQSQQCRAVLVAILDDDTPSSMRDQARVGPVVRGRQEAETQRITDQPCPPRPRTTEAQTTRAQET